MVPGSRKLQRRVYILLDGRDTSTGLSLATNRFLTGLIVLNVGTFIASTVVWVDARYGPVIDVVDVFCVGVFTVEYLLRVWSCPVDDRYAGPVRGRLRFVRSPYAVVDLLAICPFYLPVVVGDRGAERLLRIFRLFRLLKIARYSDATTLITDVFRRKRQELTITVFVMGLWLVSVSSLMYFVERSAQPGVFSSIPAAIWWGIVTLTTVGYGDVVPVTPVGRALGAAIALLGVALFALPAGIIASGFTEELDRRRAGAQYCPHCGAGVDRLRPTPPDPDGVTATDSGHRHTPHRGDGGVSQGTPNSNGRPAPRSHMEREVEVVPEAGLHARPASKFVQTVNEYDATVEVGLADGEKLVPANSMLSVTGLGARQGDVIRLVAEGDDAEAALDALEALLSTPEEGE